MCEKSTEKLKAQATEVRKHHRKSSQSTVASGADDGIGRTSQCFKSCIIELNCNGRQFHAVWRPPMLWRIFWTRSRDEGSTIGVSFRELEREVGGSERSE